MHLGIRVFRQFLVPKGRVAGFADFSRFFIGVCFGHTVVSLNHISVWDFDTAMSALHPILAILDNKLHGLFTWPCL